MTKVSNILMNHLLNKVERKVKHGNEDYSFTFIGDKGAGKSWSAITWAKKISSHLGNDFKQRDIVFRAEDFISRLKEAESGKGKVILFDEIQRGMSARNWFKKVNKALVHAVELMRTKNLVFIHTTLSLDRIDKNIRNLMDFCFEIVEKGEFNNKPVAFAKPFFLNFKPKKGSFNYNYPKRNNGNKIKSCHFPYPDQEDLPFYQEYEKRRKKLASKVAKEVEFESNKEEESFNGKQRAKEVVEEHGKEFYTSDRTGKATIKSVRATTDLSQRKTQVVQFWINKLYFEGD